MTKPLIYDFGMHIADDSEVYLRKGFRVVAIEADPVLCEQARQQFPQEIAEGDLVVLNKAVGDTEGVFEFYVCDEQNRLSTASQAFVKMQMRQKGVAFRTVPVPFTTADQILAEYGPARFVKIDIEGHDLMCLQQIAKGRVATDYLSFELNLKEYRQALDACRQMGFVRFALVDQGAVGGLLAPNPSREGVSILHRYELGQSGPFGGDLDADWLTADEMAARCATLRYTALASGLTRRVSKLVGAERVSERLQSRFMPAVQTWYDVHASRIG
jgi:FkbM family methyltransferase